MSETVEMLLKRGAGETATFGLGSTPTDLTGSIRYERVRTLLSARFTFSLTRHVTVSVPGPFLSLN